MSNIAFWRSTGVVASASEMTVKAIPPLAAISVSGEVRSRELTYATVFAWAYVLRADDERRVFRITAKGAEEFGFVQTHGPQAVVEVEAPNRARIELDRGKLSPTSRVDVAVFGRNAGTGWGAPSYVSFSRMDSAAPYSDPALTPRDELPPPETPRQPAADGK